MSNSPSSIYKLIARYYGERRERRRERGREKEKRRKKRKGEKESKWEANILKRYSRKNEDRRGNGWLVRLSCNTLLVIRILAYLGNSKLTISMATRPCVIGRIDAAVNAASIPIRVVKGSRTVYWMPDTISIRE